MLVQALLLAASAATLASAQITSNGSQIVCPANMPNGTFCAGESLGTNIIIRCVNGVAGPGNCNDNLVGEPPIGNFPSTCWQTSNSSGDAACAKNCVVYCSSGGCAKDFTLPDCTPFFTASSSSSTASSTSSYPTSPTSPTSSSASSYQTYPTSSTITSTGTTTITTGSTTETKTFTTTYCPTPTGTGTPPPPPSNGTTTSSSSPGGGESPTKTPTGPSSTASGFTGGAAGLTPMGALAGAGLLAAYFL
ncbi:hypothetical protein F5882DRAFT_388043 [Hyaloscypha sp. PMI_1271]|nr:hypothetical protein F5882DRAFT_388043 [Hyaloscypha sp. PMI_1271]